MTGVGLRTNSLRRGRFGAVVKRTASAVIEHPGEIGRPRAHPLAGLPPGFGGGRGDRPESSELR